MVVQYLPRAEEIFKTGSVEEWKKLPLFFMFIRGHYSDIYELDQFFGEKFILIDGEQFKKQPWLATTQIEKKLGLQRFFVEEKFAQREDGFYCVKKENEGMGDFE